MGKRGSFGSRPWKGLSRQPKKVRWRSGLAERYLIDPMSGELRPRLRTLFRHSLPLLLVGTVLLACNLPFHAGLATTPAAVANQPTGAATLVTSPARSNATFTTAALANTSTVVATLASGPAGATTIPTAGSAATGSGHLAISSSYPLQVAQGMVGLSLTASPGKVWIGSVSGTIEEVDSQSGAFVQGISLTPGTAGSALNLYPITQLRFDGQYIWALAKPLDQNGQASAQLFAVDPGSGAVVHQWDTDSPEWLGKNTSRMSPVGEFGISPGKIWIDNHVIDTQTFEVTKISMPGSTLFAYNGRGWMWMTGDTGGGDNLVFSRNDDPSQEQSQTRWPFFESQETGERFEAGISDPLVLAGDRMWIVGGTIGNKPTHTLDAYSADLDQLIKEKGPLASVPLTADPQGSRLFMAGSYLWLLWTQEEKIGFLYQLDPQTGATINTLDLVGDQGRAKGDVPRDIATEGDNLWVLTTFELLRIELP